MSLINKRKGQKLLISACLTLVLCGAVQQDVFPGQHEWHGTMAYPMIDKVLGGRATNVPLTETESGKTREQ